MSEVLPEAFAERLAELIRSGYSGTVELHLRDGNVRVMKVPRVEVIDVSAPAGR